MYSPPAEKKSLWKAFKENKGHYIAMFILAMIVVIHSKNATDGQIDIIRNAGANATSPGSSMYLTLPGESITNFLESTLSILSMLAFIALITERALEVFVIGMRSRKQMELEANVTYEKQQRESLEALKALKTYKAETKLQIQFLALIIGTLLGLSGIRVLEQVFSPGSITAMPHIQQCLFHIMDTAITGLAIAGGSDGIHSISAKIGEVLDSTKTDQQKAIEAKGT